jgi:hypothetical protein
MYTEFHGRLAAVRRKQNIAAIIHGGAFSVSVFLLALLLALIGEELFNFGVGGRTILFWLLLLIAAILFLMRIGRPLGRLAGILSGKEDLETAREVGRAIPRLNDRLVNTLQLVAGVDTRRLYSGQLIEASLADLRADCEGIDFTSTVDGAGSRRMGRFLLVSTLSAILLFALFPTAFFGAADRLMHFSEAYALPPLFRFIVEPGSRELVKGETVPVLVRVLGGMPGEISIAFRRRGDLS